MAATPISTSPVVTQPAPGTNGGAYPIPNPVPAGLIDESLPGRFPIRTVLLVAGALALVWALSKKGVHA
jgi:hypothetical protein